MLEKPNCHLISFPSTNKQSTGIDAPFQPLRREREKERRKASYLNHPTEGVKAQCVHAHTRTSKYCTPPPTHNEYAQHKKETHMDIHHIRA
mmetsp:Transcript_51094/g.100407  ORF Transcript_51094/g.100407 Transcript_51094/m.100407 type:complete len:91 (-) Transcript_51094:453-725(-)